MDFAAFVTALREQFSGDLLGRDLLRLLDAVEARIQEDQTAKKANSGKAADGK